MASSALMDRVLSHVSADVGIDIGTATTPVMVRGHGVVSREPSYVALDTRKGAVLAVGHRAKGMDGRTPPHISVIRPIRGGGIANYEVAAEMMKHLLGARRLRGMVGPRALVGVPSDATPLERKALSEAVRAAGVRKVSLVSQPMAAAIGAGLPVLSPRGSMIVDIGGGTTEVMVVALGGVILSRAIRIAGDRMDTAICQWMRREHNLLVGDRTAEEVKLALGCALPLEELKTHPVAGRHLVSGLPAAVEVDSDEICHALEEPLKGLVEQVKMALEDIPPEMVGDVVDSGVVLAGGGSQLRRMDEFIARTVGVKTMVATDPELCVVRGTHRMFEDPRLMQAVLLPAAS